MAEERDVTLGAVTPVQSPGEREIDAWRRRIDQIDSQIIGLLNSRSARSRSAS
jgi:chorismate mutase